MAKLLTAQAVEKLKPGPVRREVADARLTGLYLVIQPSGTKSWAVRYRYGGRPRKLTLGPYPLIDVAKARQRAADALEALAEGRDPAAEARATKARRGESGSDRNSFGAVARLFIERPARVSNKSWRETARLLGLVPDPDQPDRLMAAKDGIAARWAERQIDAITRRDVIDLIDEIADRAPISANRTLAALPKLGNWAVSRDILEISFCAGVKPPSPERSRERVLSDDELRWLWQATEADGYPFGRLVQVLMLTGQRRQEVAAMRRTELDLATRTWSLPAERTKNGRANEVPLPEPVVTILEAVPIFGEADYVFSGTGRSPFSGFSRSFTRLNARMTELAGSPIPHWTLHDLRRTAATGMASIGVAPHVIEAALNHVSGSKAGVAGVYNRFSHSDEKRHALNAWADKIGRIIAGQC